jgi:hypothetical protein
MPNRLAPVTSDTRHAEPPVVIAVFATNSGAGGAGCSGGGWAAPYSLAAH